jgi:hypothetical protein
MRAQAGGRIPFKRCRLTFMLVTCPSLTLTAVNCKMREGGGITGFK